MCCIFDGTAHISEVFFFDFVIVFWRLRGPWHVYILSLVFLVKYRLLADFYEDSGDTRTSDIS
jgi:hypothetical protein